MDFETTPQWVVALKREIDSRLLPSVRDRLPQPSDYIRTAAEFLTRDRMIEDLDIEVRLDATIDRALKRLFWLKTQKQLDREASQKVVNARPAARLPSSDRAARKPDTADQD